MSIEHIFAQNTKEFFQIEAIDDQAPTVKYQYPAVDGSAVGRFADLSIELADATGIDPASIRLTVGSSGEMQQGDAGLAISCNTIAYDLDAEGNIQRRFPSTRPTPAIRWVSISTATARCP